MSPQTFWDLLGLSSTDQEVYRFLVGAPEAGVTEIADRVGASPATVRRSIGKLIDLELLRRRGADIEVVEPRTALGSRVRDQQAVLDKVGLIASDLSAVFAAARLHAAPTDLIQPLRADQVGPRLVDLLASATLSVHATAAPPYVAGPQPAVEEAERNCLVRGVAFRALYHTSALNSPTHVKSLERMINAGEQARVLPSLRTKVVIVDGTTALLPLARKAVEGQVHAVVVSHSAMSDALVELFDTMWDIASPVRLLDDGQEDRRSGPDRQLLQLLASGLPDNAIARHLRISERTLRRRITTLEHQLAATSRFHLGVLAVQRGLI